MTMRRNSTPPSDSGPQIPDATFLKEGFVYWKESVSPDGLLRILLGYRDGERSAQLIEPRILDAANGEIILDLWRTYLTYQLRFTHTDPERPGIELTIQNPYRGTIHIADIDVPAKTFVLRGSGRGPEPLRLLPNRACEASL
jgi:hypothetical protein